MPVPQVFFLDSISQLLRFTFSTSSKSWEETFVSSKYRPYDAFLSFIVEGKGRSFQFIQRP